MEKWVGTEGSRKCCPGLSPWDSDPVHTFAGLPGLPLSPALASLAKPTLYRPFSPTPGPETQVGFLFPVCSPILHPSLGDQFFLTQSGAAQGTLSRLWGRVGRAKNQDLGKSNEGHEEA